MKSSLVFLGNGSQGLGVIRSLNSSNLLYQINDYNFSGSRFSKYLKYYKYLKNCRFSDLSVKNYQDDELINVLNCLPVQYPSLIIGKDEDLNYFIFKNQLLLKDKYFIPKFEYENIFDKYRFNKILHPNNQIETRLVSNIAIKDFLDKDYIIKSRKGNILRDFIGQKGIVVSNDNIKLLEKSINNINQEKLIVQKIIKTRYPVLSVCSVAIQGEIFGLFQYEKVRQHPNNFGTGTYLKSVKNKDILEITLDILNKLNYTGISEVEFIWDDAEKEYKIIEINPRTWKSIHFSTLCGQNLVQKYVKWIIDGKIDKNFSYKIGKYWVDLFTDIPQTIKERKMFKYNIRNLYECTWDSDDPLPFVFSIILAPLIYLKI